MWLDLWLDDLQLGVGAVYCGEAGVRGMDPIRRGNSEEISPQVKKSKNHDFIRGAKVRETTTSTQFGSLAQLVDAK
jgi:hypothetical protein